jgi:hypothetical protein
MSQRTAPKRPVSDQLPRSERRRVVLVLSVVAIAVILFGTLGALGSTSTTTSTTTTTSLPAASVIQSAATTALTKARSQSFCANMTSISATLATPVDTSSSNPNEATIALIDLDYAIVFTAAGEYAVDAAEYAPTQEIGHYVAKLASGLGGLATQLLNAHNSFVAHPHLTAKQYAAAQVAIGKALLHFVTTTITADLKPVSSTIKAGCAAAESTTTTTRK